MSRSAHSNLYVSIHKPPDFFLSIALIATLNVRTLLAGDGTARLVARVRMLESGIALVRID
jgi:hypothetical protein